MTRRTKGKRIPSYLNRGDRRSVAAPGFNVALTSPALSGILVTPQTALSYVAFYSAVNVIATDTARLPLAVYRRRPDGGHELAAEDPRNRLLTRSPNGETTSLQWRQSLMHHVLGWGNAYAEVVYRQDGYPDRLELLHPSTTEPKRDDSGRLYYRLHDQGRSLPAYRVLHFAALGFNGLSGYNTTALGREAIGLGKAQEEWSASIHGNGAIPNGLLKTKKKLSEAAVNNLRASWNSIHQGSKLAGNLAILEEDLEWVATQISPENAQLLAGRGFQVLEIARMFRLPPHKLGDYSQAHLANLEESNLDYLNNTLMGWLEMIEQQMMLKLLSDEEAASGLFIAHNTMSLMRGNAAARSAYYKELFGMGVLSPNQIAAQEHLDPIGADGNVRLVPLNMTTLARAGAPEPAKAA